MNNSIIIIILCTIYNYRAYNIIIYIVYTEVPDGMRTSFVKVTLTERRHFHTAVQVFKFLNQLCPVHAYLIK